MQYALAQKTGQKVREKESEMTVSEWPTWGLSDIKCALELNLIGVCSKNSSQTYRHAHCASEQEDKSIRSIIT